MFTTTLFGTIRNKTQVIGSFTAPNDIARTQKLMLNDDLRDNNFDVPGFTLAEGVRDLLDANEVMLSYWTATQEN